MSYIKSDKFFSTRRHLAATLLELQALFLVLERESDQHNRLLQFLPHSQAQNFHFLAMSLNPVRCYTKPNLTTSHIHLPVSTFHDP